LNARRGPQADYAIIEEEENPYLLVIYGAKPWTSKSSCKDVHPRGPIKHGDKCCCGSCHRSGIDHRWIGRRHVPKERTNRKYAPEPGLKGGL
jgi:hypothetical protein